MTESAKELRLPLNLMLRWKNFIESKPPPNVPTPLGLSRGSDQRLRLVSAKPPNREREVESFIRNHR